MCPLGGRDLALSCNWPLKTNETSKGETTMKRMLSRLKDLVTSPTSAKKELLAKCRLDVESLEERSLMSVSSWSLSSGVLTMWSNSNPSNVTVSLVNNQVKVTD